MGKHEWQPIPAYAPNPPTEPPPERYRKEKAPELDDHPAEGSIVINQNKKTNDDDDRLWDPFKEDDDL